jgi:hypothetical protein
LRALALVRLYFVAGYRSIRAAENSVLYQGTTLVGP